MKLHGLDVDFLCLHDKKKVNTSRDFKHCFCFSQHISLLKSTDIKQILQRRVSVQAESEKSKDSLLVTILYNAKIGKNK